MEKDNIKIIFGLTIVINTIAILLILNDPNPWFLVFIAVLLLTPPAIIAVLIEKRLKIVIEDERRKLIVNESSLKTLNQYIILSTIIGTVLLLVSEIAYRLKWTHRPYTPVHLFGTVLITAGLIVGWVLVFTTDFQIKLIDGEIFKVKLKDLIYTIFSSSIIILYINHVSTLASGFENSILPTELEPEENWLILYSVLVVINLIGFNLYNLKFGLLDERIKSIKRSSSTFTFQLVNIILLTFALLLFAMLIIHWDEDLLLTGVPFLLAFSFLKGNYLFNIRKASVQYS